MEMTQVSGTLLPQKRRWLRPLIIILIVVVVLGGLGYVVATYTPVGQQAEVVWSIMTMPAELKNATFVADGDGTTTLYRIHGLSFVGRDGGGALISAEQETDGGRAQIVRNNAVYMVMINGVQKYATSSPLLGVTVSSDGTKAVVAAQFAGKEAGPYAPVPSVHPYLWTTMLLHLDGNGSPLKIGNGVNLLYLDATHVAQVSSAGLVSVDMQRGTSTILVPHLIPAAMPVTLASPDREHLAWFDAATNSLTVYRVTAGAANKVAD